MMKQEAKLQLELVPYASLKFDKIKTNKLGCLYPFVETLLNEIFKKQRTYVIFAGEIFERLFGIIENENGKPLTKKQIAERLDAQRHMTNIKASVKYGNLMKPIPPLTTKAGKNSKTPFKCRKIIINYNGKKQEVLIAHTYAIQFGGEIFYHYGEFCYDTYNNYNGPFNPKP